MRQHSLPTPHAIHLSQVDLPAVYYIRLKVEIRLRIIYLSLQAPVQTDAAIQNLLKLLPGDPVQIVGPIQSAAIRADLLPVDPMRQPFAQAVVDGSRDEDMCMQLLKFMLVLGVAVMQAVGIFRHRQAALDVPGLNRPFRVSRTTSWRMASGTNCIRSGAGEITM